MNFLYLFFAIRYSEVNSQLRVNSLVDRIQSFTMDHGRGRGGVTITVLRNICVILIITLIATDVMNILIFLVNHASVC